MCSNIHSSISDDLCAPRLPEILLTLKALVDKYVVLGIQLGVGYDRIKEIEGEHEGNSRRFVEMITYWQNNSANCSWSALADAIEKIGGYDNLVRN